MKKKKLKQRIYNLESQLRTEKLKSEAWEDISHRFMDELKEYGVKTEINFPEPPVIEAQGYEDDEKKYRFGINKEPQTLSFDFSERDKKIYAESRSRAFDAMSVLRS